MCTQLVNDLYEIINFFIMSHEEKTLSPTDGALALVVAPPCVRWAPGSSDISTQTMVLTDVAMGT